MLYIFSLRVDLKGPLSGMRQFLTIQNPSKMMKNAFYFMLKALFVIETFSSWLFGYAEKRLEKKALVNYKICDVTVLHSLFLLYVKFRALEIYRN